MVPWKALIVLIEAHYPRTITEGGGSSLPAGHVALGIHEAIAADSPDTAVVFAQRLGMEEALIEVPTMRRFADIDMISDRTPDESATLLFRHLLEEHNLGEQIYETVTA
jgi:IS5 family transposase